MKYGIFASDRMLTSHGLSVEFEHELPKFHRVCDYGVALTSGEMVPVIEILSEASQKANSRRSPSIKSVSDEISSAFVNYRMKRVEQKHFRPRKLTIDKYTQIQRGLNENVVFRLEKAIESEKLGVNVLVVGYDHRGAHLFEINDPGIAVCLDNIGFEAIGSGLPHAMGTFINYHYSPEMSLKQALYITYEAKRNAERAPGVGKKTDVGIIGNHGIKVLGEEELQALEDIYSTHVSGYTEKLEQLTESLSDLDIGGV